MNACIRDATGADFSAKDFRTWSGTVLAAVALRELERVRSEAEARKNILHAIKKVADKLGNTPAICRKFYVHPRMELSPRRRQPMTRLSLLA